MDESFIVTVFYKGGKMNLDAELRVFGYSHKIAVWVGDIEIIFELDEERNYRAVLPDASNNRKLPPVDLLELIVLQLEGNFK